MILTPQQLKDRYIHNTHMTFLVFQILIMTLLFIVTNLLTFFFHGVHLKGWAEGLGRLFIPEVCSVKSLNSDRGEVSRIA